MSGFRIEGNTSGNVVEVAGTNQLKIIPETNTVSNQANIGGVRSFHENDPGTIFGVPYLISPEADDDFRLRVSQDTMLDEENFNYTAQNTGKHTYLNTTMTGAWTTGAFTTNSSSITTTTTGITFGTYAAYPIVGTQTTSIDFEVSFNATYTANTIIDVGGFIRGASNPYAPTDGVYVRFNSAGIQVICNFNGVETSSGVINTTQASGIPWTYTLNQKYQFILYINTRAVELWVNTLGVTQMLEQMQTPVGNGQPCASSLLPFSVRHAITGGAAGTTLSMALGRYSVRLGGSNTPDSLGAVGNRLYGSYQGLSGGTMGTLANYANSTNPAAAAMTNTTAALGSGLGGQFWETPTLASGTDGILCSYQVPVLAATSTTKRLRINSVSLSSYVQTAITGGPFSTQYSLAFGHTAVSLATTESATTKAPRRIALPFVQQVTTTQAINTDVAQAIRTVTFTNPIYVNPGEFIQVVGKHIGTVASAGTIAHLVTFDYGWE